MAPVEENNKPEGFFFATCDFAVSPKSPADGISSAKGRMGREALSIFNPNERLLAASGTIWAKG
jgi:hypothetical protein